MRSTGGRSSTRCWRGSASPPRCPAAPPPRPGRPPAPPGDQDTFDLNKAKQILDDAGYKDTNGDGIREMPGGGQPLNFRYAVRSEGNTGESTAEFISGWLKEIGIATTQKVYDDSRLTEV